MGVIRFIGVKNLDSIQRAKVESLAEKYSGKLERVMKDCNIVLNIKEYEKTGNRVKYALNVKATAPKFSIVSDASNWDLSKAMHRAFKKLEREAKHKYKVKGHKDIRGIKHGRHVGRKVQGIKNKQ